MKREEIEYEITKIKSVIKILKQSEAVKSIKHAKEQYKQLKKQLEELPKLEAGKWYKHNSSDLIIFIEAIDGDKYKRYGFNMQGKWHEVNDLLGIKHDMTLAEDSRVETALIAEAKKRRFKEGVRVRSCNHPSSSWVLGGLEFSGEGSEFYLGGCCIFKDGLWAKIVNNKTIELNGDYTEVQLKDILNNKF